MTTTVGSKGQVTIAKDLRDALGIKSGWRAKQRIESGHVVVEFFPPKHRRSLAGILSDATTVCIPTVEELAERTEEMWAEAAVERFLRSTEQGNLVNP